RLRRETVVRDTRGVVERPPAAGAQPPLQPVRARTDLHAGDHPADVTAAQIRIFDRHLDELVARRARGAGERRHEVSLDWPIEPGRQLARDSEVTHLV